MRSLSTILKVFVSCYLILLQGSAVLSEGRTRIVGGTATTIDKAPFLVQVIKDGRFHCGGTLVSEEFVVSAAHCFEKAAPSQFVIVAGASRITDYGIRSKVSKIMIPTAYGKYGYTMDVAVVKLATPIRGSSVKPTNLCKTNWKNGDLVQLFGWGLTSEEANSVPTQLRTVSVNVVDELSCKGVYRNIMPLTDTMFCAASPFKDSCSGDSGGPAMINNEFCGIVSWGAGCGRQSYPGVYTNVLNVQQFIKSAMKQ